MFRKIAQLIYYSKWPVGLSVILITGIMASAIFSLQIDPSMETMFIKNSPDYTYYRQYSQKYGSDQMIVVAMATTHLFTKVSLQKLKTITRDLERFENVERVLSLANAMDIRSKVIGVKVVPALEGVFEGERPLKELEESVLANELFVGNLVSKDGKIANFLIFLKPVEKDASVNGALIEKVRDYLAQRDGKGSRFYVAGSPVEQYDFIRLIRRDQFVFVPLIALLLVLTNLLIYRSLPCMILSMSIVLVTLVWTLGTIALVGQNLNLMTSLLGPVIMIVAVINSIYLINIFFEVRRHQSSLRLSIFSTMEQLGEPCFLTHLTAALGFASLALSHIPAIKSFGVFASLGTVYSYIAELVLTPILFQLLPYRFLGHPSEKVTLFEWGLIRAIERLDFQGKWIILALTSVIVVFSIFGIKKIEVDTNMVKQMKPNLPLAVATRFIDEKVTGVYTLGFVLQAKKYPHFKNAEALAKVDDFKKFLESMPEISKVNSITTVLKKIHEARHDGDYKFYKIPKSRDDLERYFDGMMESGGKDAEQFISRDFKEVRLEARMRAVGTREGTLVEEKAREYLRDKMSAYFNYQLTGNVVLLGKVARGLVQEQIHSFTFALVSILLLTILIFRSLKLGLLAAIPNLIPILAIYGLMGYLKIELSTPTAMISSIVLGLVVDASIQFLYRFRLEYQHRHSYLQALHHTCWNMGHSMFVSTMILVVGFASSVFAQFRPTIHFGVLTSLTIFFAFVCTLIVLPVCILFLKPFGRQPLFYHQAAKLHQSDSIQKKMR